MRERDPEELGAELDPEDAKVLRLAQAARARASTAEGAAVRDDTGRVYAAANVDLPSLALSALQLAVAIAASSGAASLEAVALVTDAAQADEPGLAAVRDLAAKTLVLVADTNEELRDSFRL